MPAVRCRKPCILTFLARKGPALFLVFVAAVFMQHQALAQGSEFVQDNARTVNNFDGRASNKAEATARPAHPPQKTGPSGNQQNAGGGNGSYQAQNQAQKSQNAQRQTQLSGVEKVTPMVPQT